MTLALSISVLICVLTSLPILGLSVFRVLKEWKIQKLYIIIVPLVYCSLWLLCWARIEGWLPSEVDEKALTVLLGVATGIKEEYALSEIVYVCGAGVGILNILTFALLVKKAKKLLFSLSVLIICALLMISVIIGVQTSLSVAIVFFDLCCGIMAAGAYAVGLTYEEFCVLGNIYLQGLMIVISACYLVYVTFRLYTNKKSVVVLSLAFFSLVFALIDIVGYGIICSHYWMPLDKAFDLCVDELFAIGRTLGVGYIGANLLIFVIGWLVVFIFNIIAAYIIKRKF